VATYLSTAGLKMPETKAEWISLGVGVLMAALGVAANGLNLLNVPYFYQTLSKGILLLISVFADQAIRRRG